MTTACVTARAAADECGILTLLERLRPAHRDKDTSGSPLAIPQPPWFAT